MDERSFVNGCEREHFRDEYPTNYKALCKPFTLLYQQTPDGMVVATFMTPVPEVSIECFVVCVFLSS